ncbi:MAG: ABC transporter permease [Lachnospiraceae bacterium]|nr:ABC transporter permease [Lachnospiraceae bacterium]
MITLFKHEFKQNLKSLLIWSISVGTLGLMCVLLYQSMTEDMQALSDSFSNMGAFSDAFGMSTLGIGTLKGYFATEVGAVHGIGSGMFAAIMATSLLSKEEDGHTGEFLYSLPVSITKVVAVKIAACITGLILFSVITGIFYISGVAYLGENFETDLFLKYMISVLLMNIEIACICVAFSAFVKKNMIGAGLGIALLFYFSDLICRISPDLKDYIVYGPYSLANATEIFVGNEIAASAYIISAVLIIAAVVTAFVKYTRKDLAS